MAALRRRRDAIRPTAAGHRVASPDASAGRYVGPGDARPGHGTSDGSVHCRTGEIDLRGWSGAGPGGAAMKHVTPDQWAYVIVPFLVYGGMVAALSLFGWDAAMRANLHRNPLLIFFKMISAGLERVTGYPGWAMAGGLSGLWSLGTAVVGLYWDVAWHIDFGRDKQLFTPPHTMIVIGLAGIIYTACIAVVFATLDDAPVGIRIQDVRIPYSAIPMAALGLGALGSFPLDALWHQAYGLDVTLWRPTHLMMVGGRGLAPSVRLGPWLVSVRLKAGAPGIRPPTGVRRPCFSGCEASAWGGAGGRVGGRRGAWVVVPANDARIILVVPAAAIAAAVLGGA